MTRTKWFVVVLALAFFGGVLVSSGSDLAQPAQKPIELSLCLMTPPKHLRNIHMNDPWIKMVDEKSGGRLKIKPYFSSTLAPPPEAFDAVQSGVADLAESYTFGNPGRFLLSETLALPELGFPTGEACGKALWHLYKSFPEVANEYKGVKILWLEGSPGAVLNMKKKPVKALEDLKGMKIMVSGSTMVRVGKALGLSPVTMQTGDIYEAADKGVIDGFVRPAELLISRKFYEVAKWVTEVDLGHDLFYIAMNQKKFDSLPPDLQKVLTDLGGDWAVDFTCKAWDKFDTEARTESKAKGMEFINLSAEEKARWKKIMAPIGDEYAAELEAKNLPGKKILEDLRKLAEKK
jgi:TRAP-type C4-dicarboxylate transport system substrate-binding protein